MLSLWVALAVMVGFVLIGGSHMLYQRQWVDVPEPMRGWLCERTLPVLEPGPFLQIVKLERRAVIQQRRATAAIRGATTTAAKAQQAIAIAQNSAQPERNALLLAGRADALAALVVAKKVGETEGIKLVFGVGPSSSNLAYQEARAALKAALERRQPVKFSPLTEKERQFRTSMGLPIT